MNIDGNIYALERYLAKCEEHDRYQELLAAEEERDELADVLQTALNALCEIAAGADDPWAVARAALLERGETPK